MTRTKSACAVNNCVETPAMQTQRQPVSAPSDTSAHNTTRHQLTSPPI